MTVLPKDDRTDFAQEERLGFPYWTMIWAICVVVDESKCLEIPIWEFFNNLGASSFFGVKVSVVKVSVVPHHFECSMTVVCTLERAFKLEILRNHTLPHPRKCSTHSVAYYKSLHPIPQQIMLRDHLFREGTRDQEATPCTTGKTKQSLRLVVVDFHAFPAL